MENASDSPHALSLILSFQARDIHNYTHHQPATQTTIMDFESILFCAFLLPLF